MGKACDARCGQREVAKAVLSKVYQTHRRMFLRYTSQIMITLIRTAVAITQQAANEYIVARCAILISTPSRSFQDPEFEVQKGASRPHTARPQPLQI